MHRCRSISKRDSRRRVPKPRSCSVRSARYPGSRSSPKRSRWRRQWESYRYPEGGTYLGPVDFVFNGPDRQFLSPALGFAARGDAVEPGQTGEWGVCARWAAEALDGTLGLYYRRYSDKLPQVLLTAVGPNRSQYNLIYADDIDLFGLALAFTATWFQVFPGIDLSAPITFAVGLSGNAATVFGGNEDNGNYSVGVAADIYQKYRVDLKYVDFFGRYRDNGTTVTTQNGFTTLLKDRGFVTLTLKTTF